MTIAAILWDLDGTLVDSEPAHAVAFDHALLELGLSVPKDFHLRLLGMNDQAVHKALVDATGTTLSHADWRSCKLGHYRRHGASIRRRSGVADAAIGLVKRGMASAIVSNSTADEVAIALSATGLSAFFPVTICIADVAHGKPDPEGYLLAARRIGARPTQCLVVEDSLVGASAGRAAGMKVLYHPQAVPVSTPYTDVSCTYVPPEQSLLDVIGSLNF